jgi:hypothetical protein
MSEQGGPHGPGGRGQQGEGWPAAGQDGAPPAQAPQGWERGPAPTGPQGWQQPAPQATGPQGWQPAAPQATGPQGWQQAAPQVQPQTGGQAWQPGPPPTGPQGWQQSGPQTGQQGWSGQQPAPTQGYPAQGYPNQGYPNQGYPNQGPGGPEGPGGPGQPYPGKQPAPKNRTPLIITAIAVVVALVAAAGIYLFAIKDSNDTAGPTGQASPQASVTALFTTLSNSDPIGLADQLDPAEATLFADLNTDIITELKRLEVLSPAASADSMTGTTITVSGLTMDGTDETINDHLHIVKLTGGTITIASDPSAIPLSESFKQAFGDQIDQAQPQSQTINIADAVAKNGGQPIRVATVKRGDQWYVSLFYTIADNAVHQAGLANPTSSIPADGQASPEDAVNTFIDKAAKGDLAGVIGVLPPDEMGVLHDYGQVLIDQADAGNLSSSAKDLGVDISNVTWAESDVTGGKKLSIKTMTVTADGQTVTIENDPAKGSITVSLPDQPTVTLDQDTIDTYLADAVGTDGLDQQALDIIKREFKQVIGTGLVTVQVDGKWYVSPIRSVSDIFVSLLKGLEPGDIDYLIKLAQK